MHWAARKEEQLLVHQGRQPRGNTEWPSWVIHIIPCVHQICLLRLRGLWAPQLLFCSIGNMHYPVASSGWLKSPSCSFGQGWRPDSSNMSICLGPQCIMTAKADNKLEASRESIPQEAKLKAWPLENEHLPRSFHPAQSTCGFLCWYAVWSPLGARSLHCCLDSLGRAGQRSMLRFESVCLTTPTYTRSGWFNDWKG